MCDYQKERMYNCLKNIEKMQELGSTDNAPFANIMVSPEKQGTGDSGSKSNGEDEPNNDDHPDKVLFIPY
jgi:hypothetical protein